MPQNCIYLLWRLCPKTFFLTLQDFPDYPTLLTADVRVFPPQEIVQLSGHQLNALQLNSDNHLPGANTSATISCISDLLQATDCGLLIPSALESTFWQKTHNALRDSLLSIFQFLIKAATPVVPGGRDVQGKVCRWGLEPPCLPQAIHLPEDLTN